MVPSAWKFVAVCVMKAGWGRTVQNYNVWGTAQARVCVWKASVCVTLTSVEKTAQSLGALETAQARVYVLLENVCVERPILEMIAP